MSYHRSGRFCILHSNETKWAEITNEKFEIDVLNPAWSSDVFDVWFKAGGSNQADKYDLNWFQMIKSFSIKQDAHLVRRYT